MSSKRQGALPWTPFGAACAGFRAGEVSAEDEEECELLLAQAVFSHVAGRAAEHYDLGAEQAALAWELATWQEGLSAEERQALFLLTLCTLVDQSQGSTRTPLPVAASPSAALVSLLEPGEEPPHGLPSALEVSRVQARLLSDEAPRLKRVLARLPLLPEGARSPEEVVEPVPLVVEGGFVYHHKLLLAERRLARSIEGRLQALPEPALSAEERAEALAAVEANPPGEGEGRLELEVAQVRAIRTALEGSLTFVSGGPGTGKTSIVVSLLRLLVRAGIPPSSIALAAPTGKAAQRMRESIVASLAQLSAPDPADERLAADLPEARTLHRLLGASRRGTWFRHHEHDPLAERVVIVDEGSMIDLHLFDRLVRALRPGARLIVLGDADQLPSVGAGTVLRDLIPAERGPSESAEEEEGAGAGGTHPLARCSVRLTRNYRMRSDDAGGSGVLRLARAIRAEASSEDVLFARAGAAELEFLGAESLFGKPGQEALLGTFLGRWFQTQVRSLPGFATTLRAPLPLGAGAGFGPHETERLEALFGHCARARILCPTRVHAQGVNAINASLRQSLQIALGASSSEAYTLGEPLLATSNDYDKGLFNGDQGLVLNLQAPGAAPRAQAVFATSRGYRAFPLELLRGQIERAFATTVHKAQGSEFEHVALVLPERSTALLTREVVYTAVTRARRSVVVLGSLELWEATLGRSVQRSTSLAERLR